jgi:hypothetical protein
MRFVKSLDDVAFGRGLVGHCDANHIHCKGTL